MMAGLPEPKVVSTLANRGKQIDAAVDSAVASAPTPKPKPAAPVPAAEPAITADAAAAKAAKWKADQEAFDAETKKGMVKPSLLDRAKKAVGL
jgi:hypothetical protein